MPYNSQATAASSRPAVGTVYNGPPPVVMFVGTPPPQAVAPIEFIEPPPEVPVLPSITPARGPSRPYSITHQAGLDAANAGWNPMSTDPVVAPPMVTGGASTSLNVTEPTYREGQVPLLRLYRSPMRRILQDTGRGLTRDLPEAVADALPWVDRDAKHEPFDAVLGRVADDLHRASLGDPAWALPAQREIRALSKRLDRLSAPPPLPQVVENNLREGIVTGSDDRPFRPRPIWPGAAGRPEAQVRPVTLVTTTGQQEGPRATGVVARYVPATEDDAEDDAEGDQGRPKPAPARRSARRARSR